MYCPRCRTDSLAPRLVRGTDVEIDHCPECNGLWFDRDELNAILDVAARHLAVPADAKEVPTVCPRCMTLLFAFYYPQTLVTVDMCKRCKGLWLDAREAKEIKTIRARLNKIGELEEYGSHGMAAALSRFVDTAAQVFA